MPNETNQNFRSNSTHLIQAQELRKRLGGVSAMWLYRHRDKLPKPCMIGGRRFWLDDEVETGIRLLSAVRKDDEKQGSGEKQ